MYSKLFVLAQLVALVSAQTFRACNNFITTSDGDRYQLTRAAESGAYFQCDYLHDNGDGSSSGTYCFYRTSDYKLSHYPNTSLPVDSNAACPDPLPNAPAAGKYIIKVPSSDGGPGNCATLIGASTGTAGNGAAIGIKLCDGRHAYPGQVWTFNGYTISQNISQTNFCWDVTNGANTNGAKLQAWTCANGNTNQRFTHVGGDLAYFPNDKFTWAGKNKCVDLTGGSVVDGNQLQVWDCIAGNTNQNWLLEVNFP
ncbi:ricin B lectin domain-containing protein [Mycena polygramma]|nr:ricin B lectin domain-containing protein [Mycena polygramma]